MSVSTGLIIPTITPLREDGSFDGPSFARLVDFLDYSDAFFILGYNGEAYTVRPDVKRDIISASNGIEKPVLVGVTGETLADTVRTAEFVQGHSAIGVVVQPSRLPGVSLDVIVKEVADAACKPIYLYLNPSTARTAEPTPQEVNGLARKGLIAGAKLSTSLGILRDYRCQVDNLPIYLGNAMDIFSLEDHERDQYAGVVSGPANVLPEDWFGAWYRVAHGKNTINSKRRVSWFQDLFASLPDSKDPIGAAKYLLHSVGVLDCPRLATGYLSDADKRILDVELESIAQKLKELPGPFA